MLNNDAMRYNQPADNQQSKELTEMHYASLSISYVSIDSIRLIKHHSESQTKLICKGITRNKTKRSQPTCFIRTPICAGDFATTTPAFSKAAICKISSK